MLISRRYKNNSGYQINVDRLAPIFAGELQRYNRNHYSFDGYNTKMLYSRGSNKGLQYGGMNNESLSGSGLISKTLSMLYQGAKKIPAIYASKPVTILKNTFIFKEKE